MSFTQRKMDFTGLPNELIYLIKKRLSKYDNIFLEMTCHRLAKIHRENKDLVFASSMSRFRYGRENNLITINPVTPMCAIYHDNLELFQIVISGQNDNSDHDPIYDAAKYNAGKIFFFLLENDDSGNYSWIEYIIGSTVEGLFFEAVEVLLKSPRFQRIKKEDKYDYSIKDLLPKAALSGSPKMFDYIENVVFGGDMVALQQYKDDRGKYLCFDCASHNLYHMFEYLRDKGYQYDNTIIDSAALNGALDCVIKLHRAGFPISSNALYQARSGSYHNIVKYIIHNASEISNDKNSRKTMETLMYHGELELIKVLASKGVAVSANYTVKAKDRGHAEVVRYVITEHPDVFHQVIHELFDFLVEDP